MFHERRDHVAAAISTARRQTTDSFRERTLGAVLAPVFGLVGLLGTAMADAQNSLDAVVASQLPDEMDVPGAVTIASESLSAGEMNALLTEDHYHVFTASSTTANLDRPSRDRNKPDRWLELRTETDILLSNRGVANHYYVRYALDGMVFSQPPPPPEVWIPYYPPCSEVGQFGTCPANTATTTAYRYPVDRMEIETAYRGRQGDSEVIFRLPSDPAETSVQFEHPTIVGELRATDPDDYPVGTQLTLVLPNHLAVMAAREATYSVDMKVFEDLSEAREDDFGAEVYAASGDVIKLAPAVDTATVDAMLATAEVTTPEDMGGAFRRFVDGDDDGTEPDRSANLAKVTVGLMAMPGAHANGNLKPVDTSIIAGVDVAATSEAGNFGFGASFRVGGCSGAALDLRKPGAQGDLAPLEMGDPPEIATAAVATARTDMIGDTYFCVVAASHAPDADPPMPAPPIPEVGDADAMDGYMLSVTPKIAMGAPMAVHPPTGMAMAAGAIDRNGTTVHVTYLSASAGASQRLVLVNRGNEPAAFWMDDFQTEGGATVQHIGDMMLARSSMSEIPSGGRVSIRVQDNLSITPRPPRAAGTLTVAAPERNIDLLTVQVVDGKLDTTRYQTE